MIYKIFRDINENIFDKIISNISSITSSFFRQDVIALINFEQKDKARN